MRLRQFDKSDGIVNDMIHGIHEGNDSCIWLSTNKGLTKYNPRNNFFHNYHQPYFSVTEFSDDAYWKCPYSERLFFGGINGLVWVNKQTEPEHTYQPELSFFELQMDKQILPLYKDISRNGVTVPADVQSLTIGRSSLRITSTGRITSIRISWSTIIPLGKNCKRQTR